MRLTLTLLACLSVVASANIIGFDLGSNFFKITLVKPGNPFKIVENVTSMRKTHSQLTIGAEQRLYGKDSFLAATKTPKTTFSDVLRQLGKEFSQEEIDRLARDEYVLNEFANDERGLVAFQSFSLKDADEKTIYYTEEIVGQILKYGRTLSQTQAEGSVFECVITIPSYFGQEQRRMMMDAAEIAGLKVISLIHENVAAATMFGVDRLDETPLTVLYYNMGASDTEVAIVRYSSVLEEDKKKPVEQIEILAESFDQTLGGNEWDHVLVQILADKFNSMPERKGKADVRENHRAMKRLYKEAISVKDILSANKVADVKVPELVDYVTLKTIVSRQEFEEKSEHLFSRVAQPVTEALAKAGLTTSDIAQIEILGGGVRIPRIHEILKEVTKLAELSTHLNGDEAMCFGAAFLAANSSSSFKVRKVLLIQHPNFDIALRIRPLEGDKVETGDPSENGINYFKNVTLFKHDKDYLGQKKTISLTYDVAMEVQAFAQHEDGSEELLQTFKLADLVRIVDLDVMKGENSTGPKVSLQFELSRSHLLKLVKVEVKTEETKMEEILPEPVKKDKKKKEAKESTDEKAEEKTEEKADEKAEEETLESKPEEILDIEKTETEPKEKQFKEVKVPHTFPCEFEEEVHNVRTLDKNQMKEAKKRLGALEKRDEEKYKLDESKNEFETIIYAFRAWLSEDENFVYIPEEDREKWLSKCSENEDWLYDEGASAGYKAYQTRTYELTSEYNKYKTRSQVHAQRENLIETTNAALNQMRDQVQEVANSKRWITEQEVNDVLDRIAEQRVWLHKKVDEQAALRLDEEPVLLEADVVSGMKKVATLFKKVTEKKKPKEKKPKVEKTDDKDSAEGAEDKESAEKEQAEESGEWDL